MNKREQKRGQAVKERPPLFERLQKAFEDGLRYARGEIDLKTTTVVVPEQRDKPLIEPSQD